MDHIEFNNWADDKGLSAPDRAKVLRELRDEHGGLEEVESVQEVEDVARSLGLLVGLFRSLWRTLTGWF